ncbi:hypothetical protein CDV55_100236 [Aspergillus turcosus]|uniref:Uncharacterized protein n=1 Tax=Aspergillus turcosus TaxID=1245748 RepID=A0A397GM10_9EURO|nr:hypothetical protein CDV55_100236 [Aspergillus turcosus]RLL93773.1 hypothetical protein CFD26_103582 [Aspergillus turcosus]
MYLSKIAAMSFALFTPAVLAQVPQVKVTINHSTEIQVDLDTCQNLGSEDSGTWILVRFALAEGGNCLLYAYPDCQGQNLVLEDGKEFTVDPPYIFGSVRCPDPY